MGMRGQTERGRRTENVGNLGSDHGWSVGTPHFLSFFDSFAFFFFFPFFSFTNFSTGFASQGGANRAARTGKNEKRNKEELERMGKRVIGRAERRRLGMFE